MTIEVTVKCSSCGKKLDTSESFNTRTDTVEVEVQPCKSCMDAEHERGKVEGANEAQQ